MQIRVMPALKNLIPLFMENPSRHGASLKHKTAGGRGEGQGRLPAGACAVPLTATNRRAGWRQGGDQPLSRYAIFLLAGMLSFGGGSAIAVAQPAQIARPVAADPYAADVAEASQRFGIPEHWIRAVLHTESAGDARAVSSAGAMGLMQVMPDTWAGLRNRHRLGHDPYDPHDNILAGAAYLREMFDRYGNVAAMFAAYNAGPARYDDYLTTGRLLPPETRAYVSTLVPVLDGMAASDAPPPPPDWRDAPLFVTSSTDARTAATPPSAAHSAGTRASVPAHNPDDTEPETDSIFVAGSSDGDGP